MTLKIHQAETHPVLVYLENNPNSTLNFSSFSDPQMHEALEYLAKQLIQRLIYLDCINSRVTLRGHRDNDRWSMVTAIDREDDGEDGRYQHAERKLGEWGWFAGYVLPGEEQLYFPEDWRVGEEALEDWIKGVWKDWRVVRDW